MRGGAASRGSRIFGTGGGGARSLITGVAHAPGEGRGVGTHARPGRPSYARAFSWRTPTRQPPSPFPYPWDGSAPRMWRPRSTATRARRRATSGRHPRRASHLDRTLSALDITEGELDYAMNVASHLSPVDGTAECACSLQQDPPEGPARSGNKIMLSEARSIARCETSLHDRRAREIRSGAARVSSEDARGLPSQRRGDSTRTASSASATSTLRSRSRTLKFTFDVVDATAAFSSSSGTKPCRVARGAIRSGKGEARRRKERGAGASRCRRRRAGPSLHVCRRSAKLRETLYRANVTAPRQGNGTIARHSRRPRASPERQKLLGFSAFLNLHRRPALGEDEQDARVRDHAAIKLAPAFCTARTRKLAAFAKRSEPTDRPTGRLVLVGETTCAALRLRRGRASVSPLNRLWRASSGSRSRSWRMNRARRTPVWHETTVDGARPRWPPLKKAKKYHPLPRTKRDDRAWIDGVIDRLPGTNRREQWPSSSATMTPPRKPDQPAPQPPWWRRSSTVRAHDASPSLSGSDHARWPAPRRLRLRRAPLHDHGEHRTWERDALDQFARHHERRAPIPTR